MQFPTLLVIAIFLSVRRRKLSERALLDSEIEIPWTDGFGQK